MNENLIPEVLFNELSLSKQDKLTQIQSTFNNTVIDQTITQLKYTTNLHWLDIIHSNNDQIGTRIDNDVDSVIGVEKVSITDFLTILSEDNTTTCFDPFVTLGNYLNFVSSNIESAYDTDRQFMSEFSEKTPVSESELQDIYSQIRNRKEQTGFVHPYEEKIGYIDDFDSLIAKNCFLKGLLIENVINPFIWSDISVESGKYIVLNVTDRSHNVEKIVGKVTELKTEPIDVTKFSSLFNSSRGDINFTRTNFVIDVIAYDNSLIELYPKLSLDQPNENTVLQPDLEDMIQVYDENPLPLK